MLGSKWSIALLVVLGILVILYFLGNKSVKAEVLISASPQEVWSVLTDFETIAEWNSVLLPFEKELRDGSTITYEFFQEKKGKAAVMKAKVIEIRPYELIHQTGGMQGILTFDHNYLIGAEGDATRIVIKEKYRGIMVPFWDPTSVQKAYERLLMELRDRVMEGKNDKQRTGEQT